MRSRSTIIMAVIGAVVVLSIIGGLYFQDSGRQIVGGATNTVAILRIEGVIAGGGSGESLLGAVAGSDAVVALIAEAAQDQEIAALVLRINSPGGSAAASQEIAEELENFRATGKKVITSMSDVAASGGYWIAAASDLIVANPGTTTGSIGVIIQITDLRQLYEKLGVDFRVFKSGPLKDIGSANRAMTEAEEEVFQAMVNDIFQQFIDQVATGRDLDRDQVIELADGRVFTGRQAKEAGLVDELGNFTFALDRAAELAGLGENYQVRELRRLTPIERLLGLGLTKSLSQALGQALRTVIQELLLESGLEGGLTTR